MAAPGRQVGLLGGSFNPAHGGHLRLSRAALAGGRLDEVWWLVSPGNPLKPAAGIAPLPARIASARMMARRTPIRVTAIERELGTRYTVDTLRKLTRRYPRHRFVWLMGADNLAQLHRWRDWRRLAHIMPIAVVARPGYNGAALASPAMAWFRRFRRPVSALQGSNLHPGPKWRAPTLVFLPINPDPRSASALRIAEPGWASLMGASAQRDGVTRRIIPA